MSKIVRSLCVILPVCIVLQLAVAEPQDPGSSPQSLESLKFLAGSWQGAWPGAGDFFAHYSTPEHGKILSYSELRKEGKRLFYEFEKFEVVDGIVNYTPFPGGNMKETFKLVSVDEKKKVAVFEFAEKDWPTRVVFQRVARDHLNITLTDPHGGGDKVVKLDLKSS